MVYAADWRVAAAIRRADHAGSTARQRRCRLRCGWSPCVGDHRDGAQQPDDVDGMRDSCSARFDVRCAPAAESTMVPARHRGAFAQPVRARARPRRGHRKHQRTQGSAASQSARSTRLARVLQPRTSADVTLAESEQHKAPQSRYDAQVQIHGARAWPPSARYRQLQKEENTPACCRNGIAIRRAPEQAQIIKARQMRRSSQVASAPRTGQIEKSHRLDRTVRGRSC